MKTDVTSSERLPSSTCQLVDVLCDRMNALTQLSEPITSFQPVAFVIGDKALALYVAATDRSVGLRAIHTDSLVRASNQLFTSSSWSLVESIRSSYHLVRAELDYRETELTA